MGSRVARRARGGAAAPGSLARRQASHTEPEGMRALHTVAVVLAGGVGSRLGLDVPKQMVKIAGKTILEHTIECLHDCAGVDEVVLMMAQGSTEQAATLLGNRYPKLTRILEGGTTRNESTRRVLDALGDDESKVLLHDAVRPLLDERIVADCIAALDSVRRRRRRDPVGRHDRRGRRRRRDRRRSRSAAGCAAGRPRRRSGSVSARAYGALPRTPTSSATDDCGVVLRYLPDVPIASVAATSGT